MRQHIRHGRRLALVLACIVLVALLALQVWSDGPVTRLDLHVTQWLAAHRTAWLTGFMLLVSAAHQTKWLLAATLALALWLGWRREWGQVVRLGVVPAGMLLNAGLKTVFQRPRPHLEDPLVHLLTLSFPSGHAAASTVFYGALCALAFARWRRGAVRAIALGLAGAMVLLVTFSRVYLGAHYVSDVVAGVAVGAVALALFLAPWGRGARGAAK
ncbi:MAG TPA: phosphatase PAP2 family protein [Ramlibacter sp.]|uniref:phosphatase PAP2 family protein n=1 Tax=Ramlibacter sp. TaxID=1917967 RepID=UPI002D811007|nr:phosphatase PAP2 family protein [Ramlibacter sp.]HET8747395.1 phosphatase PAP2 family protein [Ramlibacter sp.]